MEEEAASSNASFLDLPTALQHHVLSLLPPNDRALGAQTASREILGALGESGPCTACLSQPLPAYALDWAVWAGRRHAWQLPFRRKLQLLCTAACSGSEVNLEVAWNVLEPISAFPELLQCDYSSKKHRHLVPYDSDPGVAAVEAGHPQLLPWLLRRCPALVSPGKALEAAARHCDLAGLQEAWGAVPGSMELATGVLDAAAESPTPDAIAKMEWVLNEGRERCSLQGSTAAAAARSGDLGRLRWLRQRGCPMDLSTLESALQHADLAVAQWLVDEAGAELPDLGAGWGWWPLLRAAAGGSDGAAKLEWLWEWGAPLLVPEPLGNADGEDEEDGEEGEDVEDRYELVLVAIEAGQVEVVRHLLSVWGAAAMFRHYPQELGSAAAGTGSVPMAKCLRQAGLRFTPGAYEAAARAGSVDMVRWLLQEARVSPFELSFSRDLISQWPDRTVADSRGLLEAVQLLAGAGCRCRTGREVVSCAAKRGDLALVQHLLRWQPELQPGWEAFRAAAEGGCHALLKGLAVTYPNCMSARWARSPYVQAAMNGDRGTLEVLLWLGVRWGERDTVASMLAEGAELPALRWLVERGMPVGGREEMKEAAMRRVVRRDGIARGGGGEVEDESALWGYVEALFATGEE